MKTLQAYQFFSKMTMTPLIVAYIMIIISCIRIGKASFLKEEQVSADLFSITEKDSSRVTRVMTLLLAIFGLYPQYRCFKTVLIGRGWISGDWEKEHRYNSRNLYVIEPLVESTLQVDLGSVEDFLDLDMFELSQCFPHF